MGENPIDRHLPGSFILDQQIEEGRQKQGRFIKLQSGETRTFQFNVEKLILSDDEFEKKTKHVHYSLTDPKLPLEREKILPMSLTSPISINALLKKDLNLLEVKRIGGDRNKNTLSRLSNQARRK
jgi:hypothetical protein